MRAKLLVSACAATLLTSTVSALAQDTASTAPKAPASDALQEIVVTATRRPERLQDVPLSVTAFSQEELTKQGIVGYEGLARETPGVVLNKPTANFNNFTARGIATNGYGANLQSSVAVYIDELPISTTGNTTVLDPNLFDVERVEFLRGPQGTLFGSGSLSGALRILLKSPDVTQYDSSALADVALTGSDSWRQRYDAMVNVPLVEDKLALRMVGFYRHEEGWVDNLGTGVHNANTLIDTGGRMSLLLKGSDRLQIKLLASYEDSNPHDSALVDPRLGKYKRNSNEPDLFTGKLGTVNGTIDYQFDGAHFTSSTTWSEFDQQFFVDLAGTFAGAIPFGLDASAFQNTFVEEARLSSDPGGKWDWTIGTFYLDRRLDINYLYRSDIAYLRAHNITGVPDQYYQRLYTYTNSHELAGFGELTYHVTDDFWLTGGLRYGGLDAQAFTTGGYNSNYLTNALLGRSGPLTITSTPPATGTKAEGSQPSYKVSASFKPIPELTTYATIATGFRAPVVNAYAGRPSTVNAKDLIIPNGADSDDLTNYEIGAKGRWFDGRLSANLALYLIDWSNIQVQANRVSDSVQFATNIGAAQSKGIEFEIAAVPVTGLTIGLNGSFNDARVTKLSAAEAAISGAVLGASLSSPHFQGSAYAQYAFDVTPDMMGNVAINFQHVGSFPSEFPRVPGQPQTINPTFGYTDSYNNVNMSFSVARDKWTATAYVENLFDDASITYIHPEAFLASRYGTMRPRTVGIRLTYGI
ncbi:TonB-dependent receptor [Nitrospirillum viridazoti Y2]|uniref:Outer membrane receptor protein involved in Fe transport n=1 Tax=Nitrospirillum amazonense TaxID=28077 RepID=A0A560HNU8_9PROT|nr:TonB-dependent receptor [Nitrospirillum amazonense]EGY02445.1 TonB-dependent receptor [Nitrospirillum amazonense Y2]TWB47641.1 outer membrane receptor protein involved in Fe transport [Nitrospirillum amazonense]